MLFNINTLQWDDDLLGYLNVPKAMLPEVKPSSCVYGESLPSVLGAPIPVSGAAGDQQALSSARTASSRAWRRTRTARAASCS